MSGTALKNSNTTRHSVAEFNQAAPLVLDSLKKFFVDAGVAIGRIQVLPAYRDKADFGSLSIFVESDELEVNRALANKLAGWFVSPETVIRAQSVMFAADHLQVNLTSVSSDKFDLALAYHSYNTLGGLIGQLAHSVGLTLRDDGLVYKVLDGDQKLAEIPLFRNWANILATLNLKYGQWEQGFDTLEDLFSFVTSSPLFQREIFAGESYKDVPDGTRLTVKQSFAKWLDTTDYVPAYPKVSKVKWLEQLRQQWPQVQSEYDLAHKRAVDKAAANRKLNGNLLKEWTGRTHVQLGNLLKAIRATFASDDEQVAWVLATDSADIKSKVLALHASL